jgi:hypothetical protein
MSEQLLQYAKHDFMGAPLWAWFVMFVVLPGLNELVNRAKWTQAQSLMQVTFRALLKLPLVARVPVFGDLLRSLAREGELLFPPSILVLAPLLFVLGCGPKPPPVHCPPKPPGKPSIVVQGGIVELAYGTTCYQRANSVWCDEVTK